MVVMKRLGKLAPLEKALTFFFRAGATSLVNFASVAPQYLQKNVPSRGSDLIATALLYPAKPFDHNIHAA